MLDERIGALAITLCKPASKRAVSSDISIDLCSNARPYSWTPGSAWEPMELQALPADQLHHGWRQEPPKQFVPRKEPGNEREHESN